jgi:lysophospholipase L1-like esterase
MNPKASLAVAVAIVSCWHSEVLSADAAAAASARVTNAAPGERLWSFAPDPRLPNVLILGDSISIGYTLEVRALLKDRANVFRPISASGSQAENCAGTTQGVKAIDRWLGDRRWAVIHFNFGLHDLKHVAKAGDDTATSNSNHPRQAELNQYRRNLETIVRKLKSTGARLVFATTTPVAPNTRNPLREPDAPPRYNAAAIEIMNAHGIPVNDLHAFCGPQLDRIQQPRNVHFTAAGSKFIAQEVARVIVRELAAVAKSAVKP